MGPIDTFNPPDKSFLILQIQDITGLIKEFCWPDNNVRKIMYLLLDRLTHRVHILEVNDPSYRLMESKKKRKHPRWQSNSTSDLMDEDQPTDSE